MPCLQAKEIMGLKKRLNEIIAKHAGKPFDQVAKDGDRDYFMSAEEAIAYGLVDRMVTRDARGPRDASTEKRG